MLEITKNNGLLLIKIKDPKTKNALDQDDYRNLAETLNNAATDESVRIAVITGDGEYYSSGNNIKKLLGATDDPSAMIDNALRILRDMVDAFARFPKLLIGLVNGPCIGIAATTVALCDVIYAAESAYFYTPFSLLGLCAEGTGSYTFPRILGRSKASEMLLLNHKMTAKEAREFNFVSRVYNAGELAGIWKQIESYAELPVGSLMATKRLMKSFDEIQLSLANERELAELKERFLSEEAINAIINFSSRKAKL